MIFLPVGNLTDCSLNMRNGAKIQAEVAYVVEIVLFRPIGLSMGLMYSLFFT